MPTGPWTKYQRPAQGPWTKYQRAAAPAAVPVPATSLGSDVLHGAEDFGKGMLASGAGTARGAMQLVGLGRDVPKVLELRAPNDFAGHLGDIAGNVGQFVGMQFVPGLGDVKDAEILAKAPAFVRSAAELAAQSGLMAALQPARTEMGHVYHGIEGAAIGALGGPLDKVLSLAGKGAGDAVKLFTRAGRKALGDAKFARAVKASGSVPALARTLAKARSAIAGDTPTAAQVIDTPEAFQVERQLAKTGAGKGVFAKRAIASNHARVQVLRDMAGTDADLQAAIDKRAGDFAPFADQFLEPFNSAGGAPGQDVANLSAFVDPASVLDAIDRQMRSFAGYGQVEAALQSARADIVRTILPRNAEQAGDASAGALWAVRRNLRASIRAALGGRPLDRATAAGIGKVEHAVTESLERQLPGARAALAQYAKDSGPINQMEAARAALEDVADRKQLPGGDPLITAHDIQRALDRGESSGFQVPEAARKQLEDVRDSLLRDSRSDLDVGVPPVAGLADALRRTFASPWASRFLGESVLGGGIGAGFGARHGEALKGGLIGMGAGLGVEALRGLAGPAIDTQAAEDAADAGRAARALEAFSKASALGPRTSAALHAAARALPAAGVAMHLQDQPLTITVHPANTPAGQADLKRDRGILAAQQAFGGG